MPITLVRINKKRSQKEVSFVGYKPVNPGPNTLCSIKV